MPISCSCSEYDGDGWWYFNPNDYQSFPKKNKKEAYKLAGKRLGCFCKPQSCHGDVLADFLNSLDDGR